MVYINNIKLNIRKVNMRTVVFRIVLLILLLANIALIWFNSAKVSEESGNISKSITKSVAPHIVKDYNELPKDKQKSNVAKLNEKIREYAHFAEFIPIGLLFFLLIMTFISCDKNSFLVFFAAFILTMLFAFLTALGDETHQIFVEGRSFEIKDIFMDVLGSFIGFVLGFFVFKIYKKLKAG